MVRRRGRGRGARRILADRDADPVPRAHRPDLPPGLARISPRPGYNLLWPGHADRPRHAPGRPRQPRSSHRTGSRHILDSEDRRREYGGVFSTILSQPGCLTRFIPESNPRHAIRLRTKSIEVPYYCGAKRRRFSWGLREGLARISHRASFSRETTARGRPQANAGIAGGAPGSVSTALTEALLSFEAHTAISGHNPSSRRPRCRLLKRLDQAAVAAARMFLSTRAKISR